MKLRETIQRLSRIDIKGWRNDVAITPIGGENTSKYIVQAPKSSEPLMTVLATHSPFHRLRLTFLFSVAGRTMSHQLLQVYLQWNAWIPSSMSPVILQCIPAYPKYGRKTNWSNSMENMPTMCMYWQNLSLIARWLNDLKVCGACRCLEGQLSRTHGASGKGTST